MYPRKQSQLILLFFVLASCISCTITFVPKTVEPVVTTDYSFPVTGEVLETNNIFSVIERVAPWTKKEPLPEANILLTGVIGGGSLLLFLPLPIVKLKYQGNVNTLLPNWISRFHWKGTITIDEYSENTTIEFSVYGTKSGYGKRFILTGASLGRTRLECGDPLDVYNSDEGNFPYLIGYGRLANKKYGIYAVLDTTHTSNYRFKEVFFHSIQKFQFLDENNSVIAELKDGIYTIYDTVPEAEKESLKLVIALLVAYRHTASVVRNIEDSWNLPTDRYVYQ